MHLPRSSSLSSAQGFIGIVTDSRLHIHSEAFISVSGAVSNRTKTGIPASLPVLPPSASKELLTHQGYDVASLVGLDELSYAQQNLFAGQNRVCMLHASHHGHRFSMFLVLARSKPKLEGILWPS